MRWLYKRL